MSIELWIIVGLSIVIAVGWLFYYDMSKRINAVRKDEQRIKEHARQKAEVILEGARNDAIEIIGEAKILSDEQMDQLKTNLRNAMDKELKSYEVMIQDISHQVSRETKEQIDGFRKVLEIETVGVEKEITARAEDSLVKTQLEIKKYRENKFAKIDAEINNIISDVASKTVGKIIPIDIHEELIMQALKEAKEDHVI